MFLARAEYSTGISALLLNSLMARMDKSRFCAESFGTRGRGASPAALVPFFLGRGVVAKSIELAAAIIAICNQFIRRDLSNVYAVGFH